MFNNALWECWVVKREHFWKVSFVEMRMLRWMSSNILKDKTRNEFTCNRTGVSNLGENERDRLRWFGYIQRRP